VIKYTLEVAKAAGEKILSNNVFIHAVEVRKGKINVGLIAGQIDYDLKFLRLLLGRNEEIELRSSVLTSANRNFYSGPAEITQNSDLLVFYNLQLSGNVISDLTRNIPGSVPVMFILNQRMDQNAGDFIRKFFPLQTLTIAADSWQSQVIRTADGKLNPQLSVFNNENQNNAFWEKCPPIIIPYEWPQFGPQVQVWLESRNPFRNDKPNFPVLTTYRSKNRKSLLLLGSGFWRWHFSFSDDQVFKAGWSGVLSNMVRWLTTGITDKTVNLTSGKKNYEMGQSVGLKTQVFDGAFNPLNDALVQTRVSGPAGTFEIENELESDGLYNSQFVAFKDGEYLIESVAWYNDVMLGRDSLDLVVAPVNREFMVTTQNDLFLRQLSEKSGASYFPEQHAQELLDKIDLSEKQEQISKTFELWHKMVVLLIIVLLLSLEWLLRKRSGLI
jgi:hypothetical protein